MGAHLSPQTGLLSSSKRGIFQITEAGRALFEENPRQIDVALLNRYEAFQEFRSRRSDKSKSDTETEPEIKASQQQPSADQTPEDALAVAYRKLRRNLEGELLEQVKAASPSFFERLVIDLLVSMGYGGARPDARRGIGRRGGGGNGGVFKEGKIGFGGVFG